LKTTIIPGQAIAPSSITSSNIASSTITGSNIASNTITDSNIAPPTVNTQAGTTAGNLYYIQVSSLSTYKKVIINVSGYENDTTTNQTITYPVAFSTVAAVTANTSGLTVSTSLTTLTITAPNSTTVYNGVIVVEGY